MLLEQRRQEATCNLKNVTIFFGRFQHTTTPPPAAELIGSSPSCLIVENTCSQKKKKIALGVPVITTLLCCSYSARCKLCTGRFVHDEAEH